MSALLKVQSTLKPVAFNKTNPHFRSRYADLGACRDAAVASLSENGVVVSQRVVMINGLNALETILHHVPSGNELVSHYPLPQQADPQKFGGAITYARRYALVTMVGLIAEEDDDGNTAQGLPPTNGGGQRNNQGVAASAPSSSPSSAVAPGGFVF